MKLYIDTSSGDGGPGFIDYTQSVVDGTLNLEDSINVPTIINFTLAATSDAFNPPPISSYIKIVSEIYCGKSVSYGVGN